VPNPPADEPLSRAGVNGDRVAVDDEDEDSEDDEDVQEFSQLFGPVRALRHAWRVRSSLPPTSSLLLNPEAAAPMRSVAEGPPALPDAPEPEPAAPEPAAPEPAAPEELAGEPPEMTLSARVISVPVELPPSVLTSGRVLPVPI
jgi:hypothetical protein